MMSYYAGCGCGPSCGCAPCRTAYGNYGRFDPKTNLIRIGLGIGLLVLVLKWGK